MEYVGKWVDLMIAVDGFRALSALMYVIFASGLLWLGFKNHSARIKGNETVNQYPRGYFAILVIQLLPLLITGFIIGDVYIIGTRLTTLFVVLMVFGMYDSSDGTFTFFRHKVWTFLAIGVAILGPLLWTENEIVRTLVRDWEKWISWGSIAFMILFLIRGQWVIAKELCEHFMSGNYTIKRLSLQFARFFGFFFQTLAYWFVPSKAVPFFGLDPIMIQGAIGTFGVSLVLIMAFLGIIFGSRARQRKKYDERVPREVWNRSGGVRVRKVTAEEIET